MSLNPSNMMSEKLTGREPFPNMAGVGRTEPERVDAVLSAELTAAGIPIERFPECMRESSGHEPRSVIHGNLFGWFFTRAWYYWIAKGPGIPLDDAMELHEAHGTSVRVDGHCGCSSPLDHFDGFACGSYHVDNQEGLNALAETIRRVKARGTYRKSLREQSTRTMLPQPAEG